MKRIKIGTEKEMTLGEYMDMLTDKDKFRYEGVLTRPTVNSSESYTLEDFRREYESQRDEIISVRRYEKNWWVGELLYEFQFFDDLMEKLENSVDMR